MAKPAHNTDRVCLGAFAGAHGVKGQVKVKAFTADPLHIASYGPVQTEDGARSFVLRVIDIPSAAKPDVVRVSVEGVRYRDEAEALKGLRLYVDRNALPEEALEDEIEEDGEDAFYHADLVGLAVELLDGTAKGTVRGVFDFGAGDLLEVAEPGGRLVMIPFTKAVVPTVDVAAGKVIVDDAMGFFQEDEKPPKPKRKRNRKKRDAGDEGGDDQGGMGAP